jgi:hypothetical protein
MKNAKVGDRISWHVEGSFEDIETGIVVLILEWPFTGGVRAYGVRPDNPTIIYSRVNIDLVVEEAEHD